MQNLASKSRFEDEFAKLEMLGRGGFGEVWRCRHKIDNQEYAVKAVHYEIEAEYSDACQRLEQQVWREAQTWANLSHPNVVRYHNAWVEFDMAFDTPGSSVVDPGLLALLEGEPLSRRLSDEFVYELDDDDCVSFCEASRTIEIPPAPAQKAGRDVRMKLRATLYIQTELCRRDTLQTWLERRNVDWHGASPAQQRKWVFEASSIYQQCIAALSHLHDHSCMHRDLKPSNILFGQDGAVRLGDFGLAKVCGESQVSTNEMQMVGTDAFLNTGGVGTPTYASPEQLSRGCYGLETDIYALGVILAELLYPVSTQMERAALLQSIRHARCLPAALGADTPCAARLVLEMTNTDPAQRPSVGELLPPALLQEVCGGKKHAIDVAIGAKQRVKLGVRRSVLSCRRWRRRGTRSGKMP
jgi:serine/threonine protein kinase